MMLLVGVFLVFFSDIFGRAILLLFQMIVGEVLNRVCYICLVVLLPKPSFHDTYDSAIGSDRGSPHLFSNCES